MSHRPRVSWMRFSMRTMLVVVTGLCCVLGLIGNRAERQKNATEELARLDCRVEFSNLSPRFANWPAWIVGFRGGHYFHTAERLVFNARARGSLDRICALAGQLDGLKSIDLQGTPISSHEFRRLARLRNVVELKAQATSLDDAALEAISEWTQLETVCLSDTYVGDAGVVALARNRGLRHLELSRTFVGDGSMETIGRFVELKHLALPQTYVTRTGAAKLAPLTALEHLELDGTPVDDDTICALATHKRLKVIEIHRAAITDRSGSALAACPLTYVNLSETGIRDETVAAFRNHASLQSFNAVGTNVTLEGVTPLRNCPKLNELRFGDHALWNRHELASLTLDTVHPTATTVYAMGLRLGLDRWRLIARRPRLSFVAAQNSDCDDAVLAELSRCPTIQSLDLRRCPITAQGLAEIRARPFAAPWVLIVSRLDEAMIAALAGHPTLVSVEVRDEGYGARPFGAMASEDRSRDEAIARRLLDLPKLQQAIFDRSHVSEETLVELMKRGVRLDYQWEVDGAEPPVILGQPPAKPFAVLSGRWSLTPERRQSLASQVEALTLDISAHAIDDATFAEFDGLTRLREIAIGGQGVTDASIDRILAREQLSAVHLRDTSVTPDGVASLTRTVPLDALKVEGASFGDDDLAFLDDARGLQALSLARTQVSDASLARIAKLRQLTHLNLRETNVTPNAARLALSNLPLTEIQIGRDTMSAAACDFFFGRLRRTDRDLVLEGQSFDDEVLAPVAELTNLQRLELRGTSISPTGFARLADLPFLRHVALSGASIDDAAMTTVATWPFVRTLDLRGSAIGDAGLEILSGRVHLGEIDLRDTKCTPRAAARLRRQLPRTAVRLDD